MKGSYQLDYWITGLLDYYRTNLYRYNIQANTLFNSKGFVKQLGATIDQNLSFDPMANSVLKKS